MSVKIPRAGNQAVGLKEKGLVASEELTRCLEVMKAEL